MNFLRNRRYYFKVFFSIIVILVIFTLLLVTSIYYNMRMYVARMENNKSQLILSQMKYNLEYINEMIRDICISAYYSSDTKVLMYLEGNETYNEMSLINRINTLRVRSNSLIHSIHVYNNNKKVLYSTYHSFKVQDDYCMEIINNTYPLPVLKPIMRTFHDNLTDESTTVLSYFMYDLTDSEQVMDGGIVVNVDVEWLLNSLVELNSISNNNEKIYIYSLRDHGFLGSDKTVYQSNGEINLIKDNLDRLPAEWLKNNEGLMSSFEISTGGSKSFVSYEPIKDTDWILVKVQSNLTLKEYFGQIYTSLLSIAGIALVLASLVYYVISRRLYTPLQNILNMMPKNNLSATKDEFEIIHNTFENYSQELNLLKSKHNSYSEIAKSFFLRQLLLDSLSLKIEDVYEANKEHKFQIDIDRPVSICIIKVNGYKDLSRDNILQDSMLAKFAVQNISTEIVRNHLSCEFIDMEGDHFVLLINSSSFSQKDLALLFKEIQQTCLSLLNISLAITISSAIQNLLLLTDLYNKTIYNSNYRVILGNHSVIYEEFINNLQLSSNTAKVFKLEDKLVADLNEPTDIILQNINILFGELKGLEYYSIVFSVARLQKIMIDVINDINRKYSDSVNELQYVLNYNTLENNSLDEIKEEIISVITEIKSRQKPDANNNKASSIVLAVKKIIDNQYSNIDLNASKISDEMNISSSKLSNIFNRYMNMTIPEYLNNVRLQKAVDLLKNSDHSITTIMQMIGINNESYFYRLFKTKYKMTPREYVASMKDEIKSN